MSGAYDKVFVGGGFYGAYLALEAARRQGGRILLLERAERLLRRASYSNQARVHTGYHYPRSVVTAARSRINLPRFRDEFRDCVEEDFQKVYAIARGYSNVDARQFARFCKRIEAPLAVAPAGLRGLFDAQRIEEVFLVDEPAFNAAALGERLEGELARQGVEVRTSHEAKQVRRIGKALELEVQSDSGVDAVVGREVLLCMYARTNQVLAASDLPRIPLKHEIAEIALIEPAPELSHLGITVMCGPFFSTMPFPARGLHSLSHVRYTPHLSWMEDEAGPWGDPLRRLELFERETRVEHMIQDAQRYVPAIAGSTWQESLWEIKTVLPKNDVDDGRPILFRPDHGLQGLHVIMGSKIDNVYDVQDAVEASLAGAAT